MLPSALIQQTIAAAFAEDLGGYGDITTNATIPADKTAEAFLVSRQNGVIAGLDLARAAFSYIDPKIEFSALLQDGAPVKAGEKIARISGNARAMITAERVALNFLCHLSGIASLTRQYVDRVSGTGAKICDTRKTTPLLRAFEKHAVQMGGGANHRFNLSDAILIKDNHIAAAGGVAAAVNAAKISAGHMSVISVEVDRLDQIEDAVQHGADVLLLDNMDAAALKKAVGLINGRAKAEASGGVNLDTVRAIAESGVNYISVGRITHSAPWLDIGLDMP